MKLRKLSVIIASAVLALTSTLTAFAAEGGTTDPTKDVTGSYTGAAGTPVYEYSYSFGDMKFNYSGATSGTWNPDTHQFEGGESKGGWSCTSGADEITVINHSNAPINVVLQFTSAIDGVKFGFTEPNFELASAVGTDVANAPKKTVRVGAMNDSAGLSEGQTNVKVGTVTLHVTAK